MASWRKQRVAISWRGNGKINVVAKHHRSINGAGGVSSRRSRQCGKANQRSAAYQRRNGVTIGSS